MRRRLFTILAALSLLLCVATAVLWVRSYPYARVYQRDRVVYTIVKGSVDCRKFPPSDKRIEPEQASYFRRFGISYERRTPIYSPADASWAFKCPTAYPLGAFGVCPALWLLTYTKRPKTTAGCCVACGYDLCATPDRCPECGTEPATLPTPLAHE